MENNKLITYKELCNLYHFIHFTVTNIAFGSSTITYDSEWKNYISIHDVTYAVLFLIPNNEYSSLGRYNSTPIYTHAINENGFACIMIYDDTNKDLVKAQIIFEFVWNKYLRVEQVNLENGDSYVGVNPSRYVAHGWIFGCE